MVVGYSLGSRNDLENNIEVLEEDTKNVITYSSFLPMVLSNMNSKSLQLYNLNRQESLTVPYSTIKFSKKARLDGIREVNYFMGYESPDTSPMIRSILDLWGFNSYIEYLYTVCELGFLEGLIPVLELGFLKPDDLKLISEVCASIRVMYNFAPQTSKVAMSPNQKLINDKLMVWASKLGIPVNLGVFIGLGETKTQVKKLLNSIAKIHEEYGYIHEFTIQNYIPNGNKPFNINETKEKDMLMYTEMALNILPDDISVIVPIESNPKIKPFIKLGVRDLGKLTYGKRGLFSSETADLETIVSTIEDLGFRLQKRFPLKKSFIQTGKYSKKLGQVFDSYKYKVKKEEQEKLKELKA